MVCQATVVPCGPYALETGAGPLMRPDRSQQFAVHSPWRSSHFYCAVAHRCIMLCIQHPTANSNYSLHL